MPGHRNPQKLTPSVADNDEGKQVLEAHARNHAQVNRRNRLRMVAQERPPALGGRTSPPNHVWTPSTRRDRSQARGIHHGCGERPTTGSLCSSFGSDHAARDQSAAALPAFGISSASNSGTPPDATAGSSPAQQPGPYRAGSATAGSSTPVAPDRCPAAADVPVVASERY